MGPSLEERKGCCLVLSSLGVTLRGPRQGERRGEGISVSVGVCTSRESPGGAEGLEKDWIINKIQPLSIHTPDCILTMIQNELIASGHPVGPGLSQLPFSSAL